jgi:hypothetical protein
MLYVQPPSNLTVAESNGATLLKWNRSPEKVDGYVVYRIDQKTQEYKEIAGYCGLGNSTTSDTFYWDYCKPTLLNPNAGEYKYAVRAFRWEATGSGSYQNLSLASMANSKYTAEIGDLSRIGFTLFPNPTNGSTTLGNLPKGQMVQVNVYNTVGQTIQSFHAQTDVNGNFSWELPAGISGIYEVAVSFGNQQSTTKLIVVPSAE